MIKRDNCETASHPEGVTGDLDHDYGPFLAHVSATFHRIAKAVRATAGTR